MDSSTENGPETTKKQEWRLFIFIIVFLFPIVAVALMGGYGFVVWISQLIMGPPSY